MGCWLCTAPRSAHLHINNLFTCASTLTYASLTHRFEAHLRIDGYSITSDICAQPIHTVLCVHGCLRDLRIAIDNQRITVSPTHKREKWRRISEKKNNAKAIPRPPKSSHQPVMFSNAFYGLGLELCFTAGWLQCKVRKGHSKHGERERERERESKEGSKKKITPTKYTYCCAR